MERETDKRLQKLINDGNEIYSISKLNIINQCPYQAYLNYVKKEPQASNCWALLGGKVHDALQECVDTGCDTSCIQKAIEEELKNLEIQEIDFPKDRNGNSTIRQNWINNMTRFAKEFQTPQGNFDTEQLVLFKVRDGIWMQGYIDLIRHNNNGSLYILDWKTSSNFTKQHLVEAGRQLVLYAMAKEAEGYSVSNVAWIMLKYCVTKWTLKNGKQKEKVSEWRNLIKDLANPITTALKDCGYDDLETDIYISEALKTNSMSALPEEVRERFKTKIYVRNYDLTDEIRKECMDYINKSIDMYHSSDWKPCNIEKDSYFCSSLCGYGGKSGKCKYWIDYCDQLMATKNEEDDIF